MSGADDLGAERGGGRRQFAAGRSGVIEMDEATPVYTVTQAARLAGMHAQTLRQYDRLGLVRPQRTAGGGRRYSLRDIARLREVQHLSQDEGINLAGVERILGLEDLTENQAREVDTLRNQVSALEDQLRRLYGAIRAARLQPEPSALAAAPAPLELMAADGPAPAGQMAGADFAVAPGPGDPERGPRGRRAPAAAREVVDARIVEVVVVETMTDFDR